MGSSEETKSSKPEKSSSPAPEQSNVHVYPDWAAMQAYYGPRVAVPPYFSSAVASGHPPHPYMWGPPQPMMPPYGTPYAAIYAHGGVYTHPGVPLGSHANAHAGATSPGATEAIAASPLSIDTPTKSSANGSQGLMNKLRGFDGLAMSIGNGNTDSADGGTDHGISQSGDTEGSSDGSNGTTSKAGQKNKKRSREGTPANDRERKSLTPSSPSAAVNTNGSSEKAMRASKVPAAATEKVMGAVLSPNMTTASELRNPSAANAKTSPAKVSQSCSSLPGETWLQNERELKRERRKQSNRESARRSRLRKQAETEELAKKVQTLTAENMTLRSEINKLTENSEHLRHESALLDKLKNARVMQAGEMNKYDELHRQPTGTADLLARVNNSGSTDKSNEEGGGDVFENRNSGTKLHQLLDASPRADAVAAG
uniref:G-box binding protein 1 n=1 Tax=Catharanthus roseus TaxID=4058 RepID=Q9XHQ6_CATRO|nr:G-box binding protein 1 [Catharanthus roseus]